MSSVSRFRDRAGTDRSHAGEALRPQPRSGGHLHLVIAMMGLVSLGYMLWTIAGMLEVLPG